MKEKVKKLILAIDNSFFSKVVRRALAMMIPLILTGGLALALRNLPIPAYQALIASDRFGWIYDIFTFIYQGTFGFFSVVLVIAISLSFAMELNESTEYVVMYVIVALSSYGAQLNIGTDYFNLDSLGPVGCFSAVLVAYLSCMAFTALRKVKWLTLEKYTAGMGGMCVPAIRTFFPLLVICGGSALFNIVFYQIFHIH